MLTCYTEAMKDCREDIKMTVNCKCLTLTECNNTEGRRDPITAPDTNLSSIISRMKRRKRRHISGSHHHQLKEGRNEGRNEEGRCKSRMQSHQHHHHHQPRP